MPLSNPWVRYITRSYEQIKDAVFAILPSKAPEITDHTENNPFTQYVSIYAGIAEMLGYAIDNAARESFSGTARRYESLIYHASGMDYAVRGATSSHVTLEITAPDTITTDITIPENTLVTTEDGNISFYTLEDVEISASAPVKTVSVDAVQKTIVTGEALGTSNGSVSQVFVVGEGVVSESMVIRVNATTWTRVSTFAYSMPDDKHYVTTVNTLGQVIVKFSDGLSAATPDSGATIYADYSLSAGTDGNLPAGSVVRFPVQPITGILLTVTNPDVSSGGTDFESMEELRRNIPIYRGTLLRAVSEPDYINIAKLMPGVVLSGVLFRCGKTVDVYIVPAGGGIAAPSLLTSLEQWFEDKRMVTTKVRAFSAGQVHVTINMTVDVLPEFGRVATKNQVVDNLKDFLSYRNQKIKGSLVLSDLYQIIETTEGVNNSSIISFSAVPYARALNAGTPTLTWTPVLLPASAATIRWRIVMISASKFQLFRANEFYGIFDVGTDYNLTELKFKITGTYALNHQWEFYTYPYNANIRLNEQSLLVADTVDIQVTATGGI